MYLGYLKIYRYVRYQLNHRLLQEKQVMHHDFAADYEDVSLAGVTTAIQTEQELQIHTVIAIR